MFLEEASSHGGDVGWVSIVDEHDLAVNVVEQVDEEAQVEGGVELQSCRVNNFRGDEVPERVVAPEGPVG